LIEESAALVADLELSTAIVMVLVVFFMWFFIGPCAVPLLLSPAFSWALSGLSVFAISSSTTSTPTPPF